MENIIIIERMSSGIYKGVFGDKVAFGFTRMELFNQLLMFLKVK